jgi:hypothetical protein
VADAPSLGRNEDSSAPYSGLKSFPASTDGLSEASFEGSMKNKQAQRWQRERGSALLLTLLLTLLGAAILGLTVDAMSLLWVRTNAQNTANLAAAAVALEQERNPAITLDDLVAAARATAALNGFAHGNDSAAVHLERQDGKTSVLLERDAGIYFLKLIRPQPVAVRARAEVERAPLKAGL